MIRVAIDTSTAFGSVAVGRDGLVLAEVGLGVQTRHAERVLPALEYALGLAGARRADVGGVVVGDGPGSFTGVRVAAATAKGLVAALGLPLVAFPSLLAVAASVAADRPVCALLDARRGEVYAGCWRVEEGGLETLLSPRVGPVEDVVRAVAGAGAAGAGDGEGAAALFAGDGALRYRDALDRAGVPVVAAPSPPRASVLLWLAARFPDVGRVEDARRWEPSYVRASSAERGVAG